MKDKAGNALQINFPSASKLEGLTPAHSANGEYPNLPPVVLQVTNSNVTDMMPPKVTAISSDPTWITGRTHKLKFYIEEDISGVELELSQCLKFNYSKSYPRDVSLEACGKLQRENGDYVLDVAVNPYVPAGEYYLGLPLIGDKAGNRTPLMKPFLNKEDDRYWTTDGPRIPVFRIQVVRDAGQ